MSGMSDEQSELALSTRAVHVPPPGDVRGRPVSVPIYQTSVFAHDDAAELTASLNDPRGDFGYSRNGNPTVRSLELAVAGLENAAGAVATSSGMGAISVALGAHLRAGSHVVVQQSLYGGLSLNNAGIRNRGIKKAPFIVLIGANMPSILAEISFVSNPTDARKMETAEHRQRIADSLYRGVSRYVSGLSGVKVASRIDKPVGQ